MRTQMEKAEAFRALHARPGAFIIPNPWDAGTAKLLAAMGFEALATTSLGLANTLGSATVSLDAIIENCRMIADATDLPVNADLEKSRGRSEDRGEGDRARGRSRLRRRLDRGFRPAIRASRSTISSSRSSACRRRSKPRARFPSRSR